MNNQNRATREAESNGFPSDAVDRIAAAIGINTEAKRRLLAHRLADLPDVARQCRSYKLSTPPSALVRDLNRVEKKPLRFQEDVGGRLEILDFEDVMDDVPVLPPIVWQLALRIDADRPERDSVRQAVRNRLRDRGYTADDLRAAAEAARRNTEPQVKTGHGGRRHEADWPLEEITRHLLVIFREVTGRRGRPSYNAHFDRVDGPVVDFFELCLPTLGWQKSPNAIRALIRKILKKPDTGGVPFQYG